MKIKRSILILVALTIIVCTLIVLRSLFEIPKQTIENQNAIISPTQKTKLSESVETKYETQFGDIIVTVPAGWRIRNVDDVYPWIEFTDDEALRVVIRSYSYTPEKRAEMMEVARLNTKEMAEAGQIPDAIEFGNNHRPVIDIDQENLFLITTTQDGYNLYKPLPNTYNFTNYNYYKLDSVKDYETGNLLVEIPGQGFTYYLPIYLHNTSDDKLEISITLRTDILPNIDDQITVIEESMTEADEIIKSMRFEPKEEFKDEWERLQSTSR